MNRRLAAILNAEVVSVGGVMGEAPLASRVAPSHPLAGLATAVETAGGRIVEWNGRRVLAEFADPLAAVDSAIAIQRDAGGVGGDAAETRSPRFRIGVDVGEVTVDDHRISGNAVEVADRLRALAEPGDICISLRVLERIENKLKVGFAYLGEHAVPPAGTSVKAFSVLLDQSKAGEVLGVRSRGPVWPMLMLALGIWLLVAAGVLLWWRLG